MQRKIMALTLSAGLMMSSAHADFIESDWNSAGDNLTMLDTETSLEWLDFSVTKGIGYQTVVNELSTTYQSWRLPTVSEVDSLHARFFAGLPPATFGYQDVSSSSIHYTQAVQWSSLLYSDGSGQQWTFGLYDIGGPIRFTGTYVETDVGATIYDPAFDPGADYSNNPDPIFATFLVRDFTEPTPDPDPEPTPENVNAPFLLGAFGFAGLLFARRKRHA